MSGAHRTNRTSSETNCTRFLAGFDVLVPSLVHIEYNFDCSPISLNRRLYARDIIIRGTLEHVATKSQLSRVDRALSLSPPRGHMYLAVTLY